MTTAGTAKAPSSRFWDWIAKRYARTPIADEESYQKKLRVTRDYLRPDMAVLEIGCGTGSTALVHAPFVRHIRAVDISERMLAFARDKAEAAGVGNVDFEQSSIEQLDAPDGAYDMVMAHSLLHLLEHKDAAITRLHDLLKPGGYFVSSTACLGDFPWFLKLVCPVGHALGLLPMVRFFTGEELKAAIVDAGFEIDHAWQPAPKKALFIVARKSGD